MKIITNILKVLSLVTALSAYSGMIPEKYLPIAALCFAAASTFKDLFIKIGDYADDGKLNKSFTPVVFLILLLPALVLCGCARFVTKQTDISYEKGQPVRSITTQAKAVTFFDAKSQLAQFKATQSDKTQSAAVGSLSQETSGSNAVNLVNVAVQAAVSAAVKSVVPIPAVK